MERANKTHRSELHGDDVVWDFSDPEVGVAEQPMGSNLVTQFVPVVAQADLLMDSQQAFELYEAVVQAEL